MQSRRCYAQPASASLSYPSFTSSELYDANATVSVPSRTTSAPIENAASGTGGTTAMSTSGTTGGGEDRYYWLSDKVGTQSVSGREHSKKVHCSCLLRYLLVAGSASADGCLWNRRVLLFAVTTHFL